VGGNVGGIQARLHYLERDGVTRDGVPGHLDATVADAVDRMPSSNVSPSPSAIPAQPLAWGERSFKNLIDKGRLQTTMSGRRRRDGIVIKASCAFDPGRLFFTTRPHAPLRFVGVT